MNPEQFLTQVELEINDHRPAPSGLYSLYLEGTVPKLKRGSLSPTTFKLLAVLTSVDINNGLKTTTWNRIRDRYALFTKGTGPCHPDPRH